MHSHSIGQYEINDGAIVKTIHRFNGTSICIVLQDVVYYWKGHIYIKFSGIFDAFAILY